VGRPPVEIEQKLDQIWNQGNKGNQIQSKNFENFHNWGWPFFTPRAPRGVKVGPKISFLRKNVKTKKLPFDELY